jgi:hypothetical protein
MSYIEELRQRVEAAERRFGLIDEQERRYSERLLTLMNALESAQEERQDEAASHQARIVELERENGELRGMLHALLLGVEAGSRDTLADTLRDLDARLSGMVPPAATASETPVDAIAADEELAAEDFVVPEDVAADEEAGAEDAVAAAEQAVAELLNAAAEDGAVEDLVAEDMVDDDIVMEEFASGVVAADDPGSPVADMIERLADETRDFAAAEPELAFDEAAAEEAAEPVPAPEPTRKKA